MRTTAETEVSEIQCGSNWCWGVSVEQGNSRVCLWECWQSRQVQRWSSSLGWMWGTMWWSVPWRDREVALMGCCYRFSLPDRTNQRPFCRQNRLDIQNTKEHNMSYCRTLQSPRKGIPSISIIVLLFSNKT